jgi:hypothetical protein
MHKYIELLFEGSQIAADEALKIGLIHKASRPFWKIELLIFKGI